MLHLRFATHAINRRERYRQWCGVTGAVDFALEDDREASIIGGDLGAVRLCTVAIGSHRLSGERSGGGQPQAIKLIFQEEGECRIEQDGRTALIGPGQWCAYDKARPYRITSGGFSRQTAILWPGARPELAGRLVRAHGFLRGPGSVLHAAASATIATLRDLTEDEAARVGAMLGDLVGLTLRTEARDRETTPVEARRRAVMEYVERNLADTDLDVARIASAMGCSKRTLHKLFLDQGTTVGRLIWVRRLERCRSQLADPAAEGRRITDIAHGWGFSDSQHFSRAFKAQFGVSPREYRNRHRH